MSEFLMTLAGQLQQLPGYFLDANKRLYLPYLFGALLVAVWVYFYRYRRPAKGLWSFLFHPKYWFHRSARQDYWLFVLNKILRSLLLAPFILTMVPIALGVSDGLEGLLGLIPPLTDNQSLIVACFTLMLFLFDDFTRFFLHYILHKVPFLWDYHKVHHSALVLTPMTVYRSHPVETFLYACRMGLAQGLAVGVGYYLFGPTLTMYDILGANVYVFLFNMMGSNLRHSQVWLPWYTGVEKWFISPAMHQIHHSDQKQHFDSNLGSALAIWDRIFGTLIVSKGVSQVQFGVGNNDPGHQSLWQIYTLPFVQNWQRLFPPLRQSKKERSPD